MTQSLFPTCENTDDDADDDNGENSIEADPNVGHLEHREDVGSGEKKRRTPTMNVHSNNKTHCMKV